MSAHKGNYREHLLSEKHVRAKENQQTVVADVKPVTLAEVMEIFMKHQENVTKKVLQKCL